MQSNPKVTNVPINAKGGLMTNIVLTKLDSKVVIMEDPALNNGVAQGLLGYIIDPQPPQGVVPLVAGGGIPPQANPKALQSWLANTAGQNGPAFQPIIFENRVHGGVGDYVGADGTVILQLTTATNTAGGVIVYEWD